ncbi:MAG: DUF2892 domain-containing protein [Candidatus Aminicenantales bacterium]
MKMNLSPSERLLRLLFTLMIAVLYATEMIKGTLLLILGIIAAIFFITAAIGFCPLYSVFKYSSRKKGDLI